MSCKNKAKKKLLSQSKCVSHGVFYLCDTIICLSASTFLFCEFGLQKSITISDLKCSKCYAKPARKWIFMKSSLSTLLGSQTFLFDSKSYLLNH